MTETGPENGSASWHIAGWSPLAWLETVIKLFALFLAILTAYRAIGHWSFEWPSGIQLIELIIMFVLSVGLAGAVSDRVQQREIIAMGFVLLNNLGHWGMTYTLATVPGPGSLLSVFALLMLVGDLVKLVFLRLETFSVRDLPRSVLFGLTAFYIAGYAAIIIMEILR